MFWLRNKKNNFQLLTLIWGPASVYKQISEETTIVMNNGKRVKLLVMEARFIQASLCKYKDFTRTSQDYPTVFKDYKFMKNPDLHIKILFLKC